jgi:hypothetical protein
LSSLLLIQTFFVKAPQAIYQRWWYSEWKQNTTKKKEMIFTTTLAAAVKRTCETRWKLFYRLFSLSSQPPPGG